MQIGTAKPAGQLEISQSETLASNATPRNLRILLFQRNAILGDRERMQIGTAKLAGQLEISQSETLASNATPRNLRTRNFRRNANPEQASARRKRMQIGTARNAARRETSPSGILVSNATLQNLRTRSFQRKCHSAERTSNMRIGTALRAVLAEISLSVTLALNVGSPSPKIQPFRNAQKLDMGKLA